MCSYLMRMTLRVLMLMFNENDIEGVCTCSYLMRTMSRVYIVMLNENNVEGVGACA